MSLQSLNDAALAQIEISPEFARRYVSDLLKLGVELVTPMGRPIHLDKMRDADVQALAKRLAEKFLK